MIKRGGVRNITLPSRNRDRTIRSVIGGEDGPACVLAEVEVVGETFPTGDALGFWEVLRAAIRSFLSLYDAYI